MSSLISIAGCCSHVAPDYHCWQPAWIKRSKQEATSARGEGRLVKKWIVISKSLILPRVVVLSWELRQSEHASFWFVFIFSLCLFPITCDVSTQSLCDLLKRNVEENAGERALPSTASVWLSVAECVKRNSRWHQFLQAVAIKTAEQESATGWQSSRVPVGPRMKENNVENMVEICCLLDSSINLMPCSTHTHTGFY